VEDFAGTLKRLGDAEPSHEVKWHVAFVRGYEGIWLDVHSVDEEGSPPK
jgi:hypothetical protein